MGEKNRRDMARGALRYKDTTTTNTLEHITGKIYKVSNFHQESERL